MVLVSCKLRICIELYKLIGHILELAIVLHLFHTGQRDILPLTGEPHDHLELDSIGFSIFRFYKSPGLNEKGVA